ncbi:MAG: methyltransferase domain-containing protein [Alphaproteobacteria bacterium]|nr:methyltransferase domain-containing protein [Alphaproteobacteria bacterium]
MSRAEDGMWWYRGLHENVLAALAGLDLPKGAKLLDAGCGTGRLLAKIGARFPDLERAGIDIDAEACTLAQAKTGLEIARASVQALPFADASIAVMLSIDVLYHRAVDPYLALVEAKRCLAPGGALIVNLPAYEWMRSAHDVAIQTGRRFTKGGVVTLLRHAGFARIEAHYWNSLLFPLMAAHRWLRRGSQARSDVMDFPPLLDRLFGMALGIERGMGRMGLRLPFGGSILAVARKASLGPER